MLCDSWVRFFGGPFDVLEIDFEYVSLYGHCYVTAIRKFALGLNSKGYEIEYMALRERDLTFDLENGGKIVEEDGSGEPSSTKRDVKNIWSRLTEDSLLKDERAIASNSNFANTVADIIADESLGLLIDKNLEGEDDHEVFAHMEKSNARGKHKNKKKALKPPRPPKGPSLDAADRMMVKELAVLAMKKRARAERMKALKKAKAEKTSSFNSCIPALIITFLFFLVIIIQGISPRSSSILQGSPEPAVGGSSGFISVQYIKSFPPSESDVSNLPSFNSAA
ncbi:putative transmembrane protein [Cucumis melo var. makuwa]|uniref:Putative transmembrane protein n=1 Tax=Cucumis melo var. makuwa TaxID=1194695 RepID=A0A5D3D3X4_CUCMM|nr:putative transmembrane protein [Cucumis melo var. makuwa]